MGRYFELSRFLGIIEFGMRLAWKAFCSFALFLNYICAFLNRSVFGLAVALCLVWTVGFFISPPNVNAVKEGFRCPTNITYRVAVRQMYYEWQHRGVKTLSQKILQRCDGKLLVDRCSAASGASAHWSLDRMYDYGCVRKSMDGCEWRALILYLLTWLIGSGGLIGAVIETWMRFGAGTWRCWPWLLRCHVVILGWNDNAATVIKEHIESRRVKMPLMNRWAMPERILVVTGHEFADVKRRLKSVLKGHWLVTGSIYHGTYDDENELRLLHLSKAHSVIVLGEANDPSHDAHVLLVPPRLAEMHRQRHFYWLRKSLVAMNVLSFLNRRSLSVELHVDSFGLFSQLMRADKDAGNTNRLDKSNGRIYLRDVCVSHRNFYNSWAKRLFANVYLQSERTRSGEREGECVHLRGESHCETVQFVLWGFSEMGQALATQVARIAHYGENVHTYITAIDADIGRHEREYRALFPRLDEIPDIHWRFVEDNNACSELLQGIFSSVKGNGVRLVVVVACDDASNGMKLAVPIQKALRRFELSEKSLLLVRQDIHDRVAGKDESPMVDCGSGEFHIFGMRDGAGYNAWYSDRLSEIYFHCFRVGEWKSLPAVNRMRISERFDAFEEMRFVGDNDLKAALHNRWLAERFLENDGSRVNADDPNMIPYDEDNICQKEFLKQSVEEWNNIQKTIHGAYRWRAKH